MLMLIPISRIFWIDQDRLFPKNHKFVPRHVSNQQRSDHIRFVSTNNYELIIRQFTHPVQISSVLIRFGLPVGHSILRWRQQELGLEPSMNNAV